MYIIINNYDSYQIGRPIVISNQSIKISLTSALSSDDAVRDASDNIGHTRFTQTQPEKHMLNNKSVKHGASPFIHESINSTNNTRSMEEMSLELATVGRNSGTRSKIGWQRVPNSCWSSNIKRTSADGRANIRNNKNKSKESEKPRVLGGL